MGTEMFNGSWPAADQVGELACLTMVKDDYFFLDIWLRHYRAAGTCVRFYIIDHASELPVRRHLETVLSDEMREFVEVITLPSFSFDDDVKALVLSSIANSLVHCFKAVIVSDVDELLVVSKTNSDSLFDSIIRSGGSVICPIGFEVVHDLRSEGAFDANLDFLEQRSLAYFSSAYTKPVIWKTHNLFDAGLHRCEKEFSYSDDLFLAHLRNVDYEVALRRASDRRQTVFSENQDLKGYGAFWKKEREDVFEAGRLSKIESQTRDLLAKFASRIEGSKNRDKKGFWGHDLRIRSAFCDIRSACQPLKAIS